MWKPIIFAFLIVVTSVAAAISHNVRNSAALQKPLIQELLTTALKSA